MKVEEEVLDVKGQTKFNELRIDSLIALLSREGIIDEDELSEEVSARTKKSDG